MPSTGYIQVRAYESNAVIPLKDVSVTITDTSGATIAMRLTNRSGTLDAPIAIETPDRNAGESPNTGVIPFTAVNLFAKTENYEEISIENLQVFPGITTLQNLEMIPLSELPQSWTKSELFDTPAQNL